MKRITLIWMAIALAIVTGSCGKDYDTDDRSDYNVDNKDDGYNRVLAIEQSNLTITPLQKETISFSSWPDDFDTIWYEVADPYVVNVYPNIVVVVNGKYPRTPSFGFFYRTVYTSGLVRFISIDNPPRVFARKVGSTTIRFYHDTLEAILPVEVIGEFYTYEEPSISQDWRTLSYKIGPSDVQTVDFAGADTAVVDVSYGPNSYTLKAFRTTDGVIDHYTVCLRNDISINEITSFLSERYEFKDGIYYIPILKEYEEIDERNRTEIVVKEEGYRMIVMIDRQHNAVEYYNPALFFKQ